MIPLQVPPLTVNITREEIRNGSEYVSIWSITFCNAPFDFPKLSIVSNHIRGASVSLKTIAQANKLGGFFQLSYGTQRTIHLRHNATASEVQLALMNLPFESGTYSNSKERISVQLLIFWFICRASPEFHGCKERTRPR